MGVYKIVLLGGSNSVMVNGLQKGLRGENIQLTNLALGSSTSLQNLYELKRKRNQEILKNADLIITESNINEIANHHAYSMIPISTILASIYWLYEELYRLGKKILILLLPCNPNRYAQARSIDNAHRICANQYGFNIIDMQAHYERENVFGFYDCFGVHQMAVLMSYFGGKIIQNIQNFKNPKINVPCNKNPKFRILTPMEMQRERTNTISTSAGGGGFPLDDKVLLQNSAFCEEAYPLRAREKLHFPKDCVGWKLIGIHAWNFEKPRKPCKVYNPYSCISVTTKNCKISKASSLIRLFNTLNTQLVLDEQSFCAFDESATFTEKSEAVIMTPDSYTIPYFNLIDFFLAKGGQWDYEIPFNMANIVIDSDYDFKALIPDVKFIKEIIEQYCEMLQLVKSPQQEIKQLDKLDNAKIRIHSHLAYKLGQAMILNSKSLLGYIRMPYVLSYIKETHQKEQKEYQARVAKNPRLKLPKLESYPDYKEALKEKQCFTYKLGEALIKANSVRGGGANICLPCLFPRSA